MTADRCACGGAWYVAANAKSLTVLHCTRCPEQKILNSKTTEEVVPRDRKSATTEKRAPEARPRVKRPVTQGLAARAEPRTLPRATPIRRALRVRIRH